MSRASQERYAEGTRVVVLPLGFLSGWSDQGMAERLAGVSGYVVKVREAYVHHPTPAPGFLVEFDAPVARSAAGEAFTGSPELTAHWFEAGELRLWDGEDDRQKAHAQACIDAAAFAAPLRERGGACRAGRYGIFRIALTDGRVFRWAGLHGYGGIFRLSETPFDLTDARTLLWRSQTLAHAQRCIRKEREAIIYLVESWATSETLKVMGSEVVSLELEVVAQEEEPPRMAVGPRARVKRA